MASKARTVQSITVNGVNFEDGHLTEFVSWSKIPRPELVKVWAITKVMLGKDSVPAGNPLHLSADVLRSHLVAAHGGESVPVPVPVPSEAATESTTTATKSPKAPTVPTATDNGGGIAEALAEFVRVTAAASVDEDRVRVLIDEAIAALPKGHGGTVVNVPSRPEPFETDQVCHERFPFLLSILAAKGAALLSGPPSTGKSHAAEMAAEALGIRFVGMLACSPDVMPSSLKGFMNANGVYVGTPFRDAYENGGLFVIDEADNAPSAITVGIVNTALESGCLTFPDATVKKHPEFRVIATANTFGTGPTAEFSGRFALDASTQTRFGRVYWTYSERVDYAVIASTGAPTAVVDGVMAAMSTIRDNIKAAGFRMFCTSREGRLAATLLAMGESWADVLEACLIPAGTSDDQRRQILNGVIPVSA
jgi:cobaltochelatase CobS